MLIFRPLALLSLSMFLCASTMTACTAGETPDAGAEPDGEPSDAGPAEPEDNEPEAPPERPADCAAANPFIYEIRGSVETEAGLPAVGAKAQMCVRTSSDLLVCLQPADVEEDGSFVISVPENARCMNRATTRVLVPLADSATVYCPVDLDGEEGVVELETPYVIVDTQQPTALPPIGDETAARDVDFDSGLSLDIVPDDMFGQDYERIAARVLGADGAQACAVADAPVAFDGFVAFSPEGDLPEGKGAGAQIPTDLAAGTQVDIYVQGGLLCTLDDGTELEEAVWGRVGTAEVDPTGAFIDVTGDITVPCLNWLGYVVLD